MKACPKCNESKPLTAFGTSRRRNRAGEMVDRIMSWCRRCCAIAGSQRRVRDGRFRLIFAGPCVCGAEARHHEKGRGGCRATGCPEFFERGL